MLTPGQLRSSAWLRLGRDIYCDSRVDRVHELQCHAAALWLPPEAAFAGHSAAVLMGVGFAAGFQDPVHVNVPTGFRLRSRQGLRVHQVDLVDGDVITAAGVTRTCAIRTAWDLACWGPHVVAVPITDHLLRSGAIDRDEMNMYIAERRGDRGWLRAKAALGMADPGAQSPQESRLRVRLVLAGLPTPVAQHPVRCGSVVLHPDLGWSEYKVGLEYDGLWHATAEQLHRDRQRLNLLVGAGWTILHVTSQRLSKDFDGIVNEVRAALRANGWPG